MISLIIFQANEVFSMEDAYYPIKAANDEVEKREHRDEDSINAFCSQDLQFLLTSIESNIGKKSCVGNYGGNNEKVLNDDPGSKRCDANSNGWTRVDGRDQKSCQ